ncbi:QRFP-like peptide receptor [Ptychodera flava]|uniref:QRFP-like peptide receptor n=1 Tax=Ptychodera flava TaxID=63121 RepID=UPI00396A4F52
MSRVDNMALRYYLAKFYKCFTCLEASCNDSTVFRANRHILCSNESDLQPTDIPLNWLHSTVSPTVQYVAIAVYSVAIALSLSGNLTVIAVLSRSERSRSNLDIYLMNLAVADIAMAIFCMPFTFISVMLQEWIFGDFMCPTVNFIQQVSVLVSIFTLLVISVGRWRAVESPLRVRTKSPSYRKLLTIAFIWLLAINIAVVQLIVTRTYTIFGVVKCNETWPWNTHVAKIYEVCYISISFLVPLVIMCAMYGRIAQQLWNRNVPDNDNKSRHEHHLNVKWKVIRMVLLVVLVFFFCWLPLHVVRVLHVFSLSSIIFDQQTFTKLYLAVHFLAMSDSFLNPFIYTFLNENFRADLKYALPCIFKKGFRRHQYSFTSKTEYTRTSSIRTVSNV